MNVRPETGGVAAGSGAPAPGSEARNPDYTPFHPRWYRRRIPIFWWLRKFSYTRFIVRELTSVPVGYAALLLVAKAWALGRGPETYEAFVALLRNPWMVVLNILMLIGLLTHTVTWLKLAPKALVLHLRGRRVPDLVVQGAHFGGWIVLSGAILALFAGGWP